jgi:hypothetical protein
MEVEKTIFTKYPEVGALYRHYKGGKYKVITLAKHSETDETMVVYQSIHFGSMHVRPLNMWFEEVEIQGLLISRFQEVQ